MKKLIFIFLLFQIYNLKAAEPRLSQILDGLKNPWSLTFVNQSKILITEKSGKILLVNLDNKIISTYRSLYVTIFTGFI